MSDSPRPNTPPQAGDASFGLDVSADVDHHLEGRRWIPKIDDVAARLSPRGGSHHRHHHRHHHHGGGHSYSRQHSRQHSRDDAVVAHLSEGGRADGRPSSSSGRIASPRSSSRSAPRGGPGSPPLEKTVAIESAAPGAKPLPTHPPTGSLTRAIFSPSSLTRRLTLIGSSIFVNMFLPFVNGTMVGLGEILARGVVLPLFGIGIGVGMRFFRGSSGEI